MKNETEINESWLELLLPTVRADFAESNKEIIRGARSFFSLLFKHEDTDPDHHPKHDSYSLLTSSKRV